jgi:hypothetical protein
MDLDLRDRTRDSKGFRQEGELHTDASERVRNLSIIARVPGLGGSTELPRSLRDEVIG